MTPPPTIDSILWRPLTANELCASAIAKGSMHLAIEYLYPAVIAHAIRECERHCLAAKGIVFHRAVAHELALAIETTLMRLLRDGERAHGA